MAAVVSAGRHVLVARPGCLATEGRCTARGTAPSDGDGRELLHHWVDG